MSGGFGHRLSGWTLVSDRPLPPLPPLPDTPAHADIRIDFAPLEPLGAPDQVVGPFHLHGPALVDLRPSADIAIRIGDGRWITISAADGVTDSHLSALLLGPAMAVLAQQRGQPALHASAVAFGDRGIALAGHRGAGKSTTSQVLLRRGGRLLTDDQLIVDPDSGIAQPSFPQAKLCPSSGPLIGIDVAGARVAPGVDKYQLSAADHFRAEPCGLDAIVVLVPAEAGIEARGERLPPAKACSVLHRLIHYGEIGQAMGRDAANLAWAAKLARRVPVHLVHRSSDPGGMASLLTLIETIAHQPAGA